MPKYKKQKRGSGWRNYDAKQSTRHSNAVKYGHAGGKYAGMSFKRLKSAGVKLKPTIDSDGDGVPNALDCRPLNRTMQDIPIEGDEMGLGFWVTKKGEIIEVSKKEGKITNHLVRAGEDAELAKKLGLTQADMNAIKLAYYQKKGKSLEDISEDIFDKGNIRIRLAGDAAYIQGRGITKKTKDFIADYVKMYDLKVIYWDEGRDKKATYAPAKYATYSPKQWQMLTVEAF